MDLATNFEELMQRSPISPHEMKSFLREMRRTTSGTVTVSKLLASKFQSTSEAQAIHAFEFLEAALESESEGSIEFRTEIGRYRFLNEIIRILSPKYLGDKTPEAVKERAIKFLEDASGPKRKRWFPSEHSKVNSVYQSLVDGGIIQKPSRVADEDAEFQKSIFERGENAVILKRLLQSKDPSDLQAANRLIKNLVDEEARRNERRAELHSLIDRIETSTGLLTEMLTQPDIENEIVEELAETCRSLREKLGGVATETNDEATSLLQASENIENVLILYDSKKNHLGKRSKPQEKNNVSAGTLANGKECTSERTGASATMELSLADQLLMNLGDEKINGVIQQAHSLSQNNNWSNSDNLLLNLDIDLTTPVSIPHKNVTEVDTAGKVEPVEPFDEISKLSREMMEQGLRGMPNLTQSKKTDKTPLSLLKKQSPESQNPPLQQVPSKTSPSGVLPSNSQLATDPVSLLDLDFLEKPSYSAKTGIPCSDNNANRGNATTIEQKTSQPTCSSNGSENLLFNLENEKYTTEKNNKNDQNDCSTKLSDKTVQSGLDTKVNGVTKNSDCKSNTVFCLNAVKELDLEKIDLLENIKPMELSLGEEGCKDVSLTLTFATYPSFPSFVCVAVITLTNRSRSTGLVNYVFQLMPPKGLQVKLLPPACMELPPWKKTFLPPPILTQVALIALPSKHNSERQPKIKFILSYCVDDETTLQNGDFSLPSCLFKH